MRTLFLLTVILWPAIVLADGMNTQASISFDSSDESFKTGSRFKAVIHRGDLGVLIVKGKVGESSDTPFTQIGRAHSEGIASTSIVEFSLCQRLRGKLSCSSKKFGGIFLNNNGNETLLLPISAIKQRGARKGIRSVDLFLIIEDGSVKVRSWRQSSTRSAEPLACEMLPNPKGIKIKRGEQGATLSATNYLTLALHADSRLYSLFGESTADIIAIALQSVASIYQSQIGLELRVLGITIFSDSNSDPFSTSTTKDHVEFLGEYLTYVTSLGGSSADLSHLLTAQKGFQGAIGVAYTGAACNSAFNVGFSDYSSGLGQFIVTIAHEMGHGLNASHDNSDTSSIMSGNGGARSRDPYFSNFSKSEILPFIESISTACLLDSTASPPPTPSVTTVKRPGENPKNVTITVGGRRITATRGSVRGQISVKRVTSNGGRIVELRSYPSFVLQKIAKTNRRGIYSFSVRPSGSYYVVDRMSRKGSNIVRF